MDATRPKSGLIGSLTRFLVLISIKVFARLFYTFNVEWIGEKPSRHFEEVRLGVLLNHTSLFEPLYASLLPTKFLWRLARYGVFPGADVTLQRPLVGRFFRLMAPDVVTITRRRDETWELFLKRLAPESIVLIAPEGRMKRPNGLDKEGKPMTVRGGIVDVLRRIQGGKMVLTYSGGLHHVQAPGEAVPRLFRKIHVRFEALDIDAYKESFGLLENSKEFKLAITQDLEQRRDRNCPSVIQS